MLSVAIPVSVIAAANALLIWLGMGQWDMAMGVAALMLLSAFGAKAAMRTPEKLIKRHQMVHLATGMLTATLLILMNVQGWFQPYTRTLSTILAPSVMYYLIVFQAHTELGRSMRVG